MRKSLLSLFLLVCGASTSLCAASARTITLRIPIEAVRISEDSPAELLSELTSQECEIVLTPSSLAWEGCEEEARLFGQDRSIRLKINSLKAATASGIVPFDIVLCGKEIGSPRENYPFTKEQEDRAIDVTPRPDKKEDNTLDVTYQPKLEPDQNQDD